MTRSPAFMTGEDPAYYAVLGVASDADADTIAAAYRALMRRHHPDAALGDPAAEGVAKRLNEAFSVVGHADLRAQYDAVHGYPRTEDVVFAASARTAEAPSRSRPARQPSYAPAEEHGASAMMVVALFIAATAVALVVILVALAREQRAEFSAARQPQGVADLSSERPPAAR